LQEADDVVAWFGFPFLHHLGIRTATSIMASTALSRSRADS